MIERRQSISLTAMLAAGLALALAACGGASSSGSGSSVSGSSGSGSTTGSAATGAGGSAGATRGRSVTPRPGVNIRAPATFSLSAGGLLNPPTISIPASVPTIALSITSADAKVHGVTVSGRAPVHLTVLAHGHVTVRLQGLTAGSYPVAVDGVRRATLVIGGAPGP